MKKLNYLLVLFIVVFYSCKEETPEPTFPTNSHRIKEILLQTGGEDFSKEIFTYEEERLVKKELVPLVAVEDLDHTETYSYNNNVITSISDGYSRGKKVVELDGITLNSITSYANFGDEYEKQSMIAFTYQGDLIGTYSYTNYISADSSNTIMVETVITDNKIIELKGNVVTWVDGQPYETKIVFNYEGDKNVSQIQLVKINELWVDLEKWDYIYENDVVVKTQRFDYENSEWIESHITMYEYNEHGYLSKEYNNYFTKIYSYEEGNGNAYIFDYDYFLNDLDPTPYYKSCSLNQDKTESLTLPIIQQIISSQVTH